MLCDIEISPTSTSCSGGNVGSDDAGRISDLADWHYRYDAEGRLVSACDDDDCVGSGFERLDFTYDGAGHRTAILATPASGPAVETTFRYQGDAIVAEYVDATLTREYVTDDGGTISKVIVPAGGSAGTYLVTWNGHGDAMALYRIESDGSLTLANSYTYSTWGSPTTATHNGIADLGFRFLYVGAADVQWDAELGLHYMHARHYSPALGRFLQPDPSRLDAQLFVYAGNGPVSRVDPSGETGAELLYCTGINILNCAMAHKLAVSARKATVREYGNDRDANKANAFKHCVWAGACAMSMGRTIAKEVTDAHEDVLYGNVLGAIDDLERMDLRNNKTGISLGLSVNRSRYTGAFGIVRQSALIPIMVPLCKAAVRRGVQGRPGGLVWLVK